MMYDVISTVITWIITESAEASSAVRNVKMGNDLVIAFFLRSPTKTFYEIYWVQQVQ